MDVVVGVGGWEHECCGAAVERHGLVDFGCIRQAGPDGRVRVVETHHHIDPEERVRGRVTDIQVVSGGGTTRPILRLPSGRALRGSDDDDDGHLEDPWTGEVVTRGTLEFLVVVRTPG